MATTVTRSYAELATRPAPRLRGSGCPTRARCAGTQPGRRLLDGPALVGGTAGGRMAAPAGALLEPRARGGARRGRRPGPGRALRGAGLRRHRDPLGARPARRSTTSSTPAVRSPAPVGRLMVIGTPPEDAGSPGEADRPARAGGLHPLGGQGGRPRAPPRSSLRRPRRRGRRPSRRCASCSARAPPSCPARSSGSARARARPRPTGTGRSTGGSPWSPAPRAASARRSPRSSPATARTSSAWTSRPRATGSRRSPTTSAARRCSWTSPRRTRRSGSPGTCSSATAAVDVVVHNAGITRDKTLARMSETEWDR